MMDAVDDYCISIGAIQYGNIVSMPTKSAVGIPKTHRGGFGGVAGAGAWFYVINLLMFKCTRSVRASDPTNQPRCCLESAVSKIGSTDSFLDSVGLSKRELNDSFIDLLRPTPQIT